MVGSYEFLLNFRQVDSSEAPILSLASQGMARFTLTLHSLATYEVRVLGWLGPSWADHAGKSAIVYADDAEAGPLTIVTLCNVDQSALIGLLNALFASGVPLLSVKHIPDTSQTEKA